MTRQKQITIEGYTIDEILDLPDEQVERLIFCVGPFAFRAGSSEILGQFKIEPGTLVIELAHIDGGGEGILPVIWSLANRYAIKKGLSHVEWIVHAVNCARPNPKLRRTLERKGFVIKNLPDTGSAYYCLHQVEQKQSHT